MSEISAIVPTGITTQNIILKRVANFHNQYSLSGVPTSPHPLLSGNKQPNHTALKWLENRYKCNQFVGDILTLSGLDMPTYTMADGSKHYVNAEALPNFPSHFEVVASASDLKTGDLVVFDYQDKAGQNGAHVEIVVRKDQNSILLAGAKKQGTALTHYLTDMIENLGTKAKRKFNTYLLRPISKFKLSNLMLKN